MQMKKILETVNVKEAKNQKELAELIDRQIKILEATYRKIHNDVAKLRADVDAAHP